MSDEKKTTKAGKRIGLWIGIVLLLLLIWGAFSMYVYSFEGVFPNVYVQDTELSGASREEALALVEQAFDNEELQHLDVTFFCMGDTASISTTDLGCMFRYPETVDRALEVGRESHVFANAVTYLRCLFQKTELEPDLFYNRPLLEQLMNQVADPHETKPVGHTFEMTETTVTVHGPVNGFMADREEAVKETERRIARGLPSALELEPEDCPAAELDFDTFYTWLTGPSENAYYEKGDDGKVAIVPEKLQCFVDKEVVKDALSQLEISQSNTVTFPVTTEKPEITKEILGEQLYSDTLSTYTTYFSGTAARNNNVRLATSRVNGYELMPGEEFSYDTTILPRTAANGYMAAPVYVGNRTESGMGGGICQPSSTLYCAALYANLEITERHNHSMLVSYLPAGMDATIAQGALDLKFKNNTPYPIKIEGTAQGGVLTFKILGYNPENISVEILRGGGGLSYSVTRVVKKDGKEIFREQMGASRYIPPEESKEPEPTESAQPTDGVAPTDGDIPAESAAPVEGEPTAAPTAQTPAQTPVPTGTEVPVPTPSAIPEPTESGIITE